MPALLDRPTAKVNDQPMVRRNDMAVKIDAEVIAEAKMVAASRSISLAEYLSEILRPIVHRDLEEETSKRLKPRKQRGSES